MSSTASKSASQPNIATGQAEVEQAIGGTLAPVFSIVPMIGIKAMLDVTKEIVDQPVQAIADTIGKQAQELTSLDVLLYTWSNVPLVWSRAMSDATKQQLDMWRTMTQAMQTYNTFLSLLKAGR